MPLNKFFILRRFTRIAYRVHGVGLGRLCEAIRRWSSRHAPTEPLLIQDFRGRAKFWCYLQEHMSSKIFWNSLSDHPISNCFLIRASSVFYWHGSGEKAGRCKFSIDRLDVIKLNVEGAERAVLPGATETFEKL